MGGHRELHFEWDIAKAFSNEWKHGVAFTLAAKYISGRPHSGYVDEEHSILEERWIALGLA